MLSIPSPRLGDRKHTTCWIKIISNPNPWEILYICDKKRGDKLFQVELTLCSSFLQNSIWYCEGTSPITSLVSSAISTQDQMSYRLIYTFTENIRKSLKIIIQTCTCTNKKNFYIYFFLNARCSASYKIMGVNDLYVIDFAQRKNG